ncbi:MAG TPA: type VII secretion-associated protein [Pseudonocardia sp.]|nr:type VII secretion-associated protein [Pseudonocardia sp.]
MIGPPSRAAVQVGGRTVRVAAVAADGEPWLVAERPAAETAAAELLSALFEPGLDQLVVVHPVGWTEEQLAACVQELAGRAAARVDTIPVPRAAAAEPCVVLDIGHTGADVTRLAADGDVLSCRTSDVGGALLDEVVVGWLRLSPAEKPRAGSTSAGCTPAATPSELASARWIREQLSLLPTVESGFPGAEGAAEIRGVDLEPVLADALAAAVELLAGELDEGPAPVLLIGGVARAPLLAELVDAAGHPEVVVADRPDAGAVLGALRPPAAASNPSPGRDPPPSHLAPEVPRTWFPPPGRRPLRAALVALGGTALTAGLLWIGVVLFPPGTAAATAAGVLVQYGYRLDVPAGWEHTGGLPERRRVLLTPGSTPEGREVIAVERTPLGYDTDVERSRALAELRAEFDAAVAGGSSLSGFRVGSAAGRQVVRYAQRDPDGRSTVDWFVVLDGDAQFSVGCRHDPTGGAAVRAACDLVVGSVRRS